MGWLLDTNILSEIRRLKPEPKVLAFVAGSPLAQLYVSVVTLAELRFGIHLLNQGSALRTELEHWLTQTIVAGLTSACCVPVFNPWDMP